MAIPTYSELLAQAKTAMLALLQRQIASYSLNGVNYTYHNIGELEKLIERLEGLAARESGSRPTILLSDISGGAYDG